MNLDDQQLDALLKGVEVPTDLQARLKQHLAESAQRAQPTAELPGLKRLPAENRRRLPFWAIAVAASLLLGLGAGLMWMLTASRAENPSVVKLDRPLPEPADPSSTKPKAAEAMIAELDRQLATQKALLRRLETQRLQNQVEQIEQELAALNLRPCSTDPSLTLAYVAESTLKAGSSTRVAKEDLELVITRFPDSPGAELARSLLAKID